MAKHLSKAIIYATIPLLSNKSKGSPKMSKQTRFDKTNHFKIICRSGGITHIRSLVFAPLD